MKKNLTIRCEDDSVQYVYEQQPHTTKNQRTTSPFSKTNRNFNFINSITCSNTPHTRQFPRQSFQFKSSKYVGIIQKNILQRLKYYDQKHKDTKQTQDVSIKIKEQQFAFKQLKQKPQINQISKQLFQKRKQQRNLSPNILQRFQTYECQRVSRTAKYDLRKANGMDIKNTTFACRKNMNKNSKSRSPLKDCTHNQNRSKSKSMNGFKKTMKNVSDIGKIVQRKQTQNFASQKETQLCRSGTKQTLYDLISNQKLDFLKKEYSTRQNLVKAQMYNQRIESKANLHKSYKEQNQLSPICQKKSYQKSQKWKVIV